VLIIQLPVRANGITGRQQPVAEGGNSRQYLIGFLWLALSAAAIRWTQGPIVGRNPDSANRRRQRRGSTEKWCDTWLEGACSP
jgi:hypothetical protein